MIQSTKKLAKFLSYVLGRRPDEFGLVPDDDGFVKIKELLKSLSEEDGWKHVRKGLLNELVLTSTDSPIEINDSLIRATDRSRLEKKSYAEDFPGQLFTYLRKKAYPFAVNKGIFPQGSDYIILCKEKEMAERIGGRRGLDFVILTVSTRLASDAGCFLFKSGEELFLTKFIPKGCFTGPPLPKQKDDSTKKGKKKFSHKKAKEKNQNRDDQVIIEDPFKGDSLEARHGKYKKESPSWKRDKKRIRREKGKQWPE